MFHVHGYGRISFPRFRCSKQKWQSSKQKTRQPKQPNSAASFTISSGLIEKMALKAQTFCWGDVSRLLSFFLAWWSQWAQHAPWPTFLDIRCEKFSALAGDELRSGSTQNLGQSIKVHTNWIQLILNPKEIQGDKISSDSFIGYFFCIKASEKYPVCFFPFSPFARFPTHGCLVTAEAWTLWASYPAALGDEPQRRGETPLRAFQRLSRGPDTTKTAEELRWNIGGSIGSTMPQDAITAYFESRITVRLEGFMGVTCFYINLFESRCHGTKMDMMHPRMYYTNYFSENPPRIPDPSTWKKMHHQEVLQVPELMRELRGKFGPSVRFLLILELLGSKKTGKKIIPARDPKQCLKDCSCNSWKSVIA